MAETGEAGASYAVRPAARNLMVATRCEALGRGTGFGIGEPGDPANTISAAHSHGVFATAIPINDKATRWQGGGESRNHDGSGNGLGIGKEGDPSPTLTAGDRHGVMCMTPWDAQSQRVYDGNGVSPTLSSRENSGLNREAVLCAGFKAGQGAQAGGIGYGEEVSPTLAAVPSGTNRTPDVARAILYQPKSAMEENWAASETKNALRAGESKVSHAVMCEDVSHALRANGACAYREDAETYPVQNMVVRRLTPMECERLQGFPDGWTDIGEWRDSKGKLRKPSDSPRYKALGNSIALPFWDFLAKRISAQYIRPVTMGSLFDGIGGFPLVFERHNGKGTARWASEIEEFPIAVTKLRLGGEDNGSQEVLLAEAEA